MLEEQEYVPGSIKTPSKFNPAMMKYSSPEAQKLVEKDIQVMGKLFNKASQQSIKAFVDTSVSNITFPVLNLPNLYQYIRDKIGNLSHKYSHLMQ